MRTSLEHKLISQNKRREFNGNVYSAALSAFQKKSLLPGIQDVAYDQLDFCADPEKARKNFDSKAKSFLLASTFKDVDGYSDLILKIVVELIATQNKDIAPERRGTMFLKAYLIAAAPGMKGNGHNRKMVDCIIFRLMQLIGDLELLAKTMIEIIAGLRRKEPSAQ